MNEHRLLAVTPTRRDGEVTRALLQAAGVECLMCRGLAELAIEIERGAGALILTDIAASDADMRLVLDALARQPAWSDIPVLVLAQEREHSGAVSRMLAELSNVMVLDRPVSARTLVSAAQAVLRGRLRQFQIRDELVARQRAEEALREADRRKDEFLATLAHELRNPLAPIRTGLQTLPRLAADDARRAELPRMMERQLAQLVKLIDDLLDVSRIATGKIALRLEDVDMRTVVEAALEGNQPAIELAGHQLELRMPEVPVRVRGDPSRLAQVLGNLVSNATKYTPPGGRIRITLRHEGGHAVVEVSDSGVGIPSGMLERVFGMFMQIDGTLAQAQGGLGIGLSLARRLAELHGGTLRAASEGRGRGSTFTLRLPAVAAAPARAPAPAVADRSRNRLRVLVVDDNVAAADALAMALALDGHCTRTAYSGEQALEAAGGFMPDAVFCDLGLPGMDGHEVARRLRADPRQGGAFLVALTGWGSKEARLQTRSAGFDAHLTKPASMDSIDALLSRIDPARTPAAEASADDAMRP